MKVVAVSGLFAYECLNTWSETKINSAASCLLDIGIFGECQLRNKKKHLKGCETSLSNCMCTVGVHCMYLCSKI